MCDALLRRGVPDRTHAMNTFDLTKVVRPNIQKLKPYRCARDDYSDGQLMDANENSLGPPMNVDIIDAPERYPCPHQRELKTLYAKWRGVEPKQVFLGVGSDEAIDLLVRMACTPGKDSILTLPPTYGMYGVCAQVNDVNVVKVPLEDGFMMNTKKVLSVIENQPKQSPIKLVFVCHPNNPTGTYFFLCCTSVLHTHTHTYIYTHTPKGNDVATTKELEKLANSIGDAILVIDEAYVDFSDRASTASLISKCPNVAVLQTFSKSWGLAGVRCGVCMAHEDIVDYLTKMKAPYNLNKMTSRVATKAMSHVGELMRNIKLIVNERNRVASELEKIPGVVKVFPSHSNFILFRIKVDAAIVHKTMATKGEVVIRYRGRDLNCEGCLRVSIGSRKENDKFLTRIREYIGKLL
jgi:histidinol-phosphate aminotransferase